MKGKILHPFEMNVESVNYYQWEQQKKLIDLHYMLRHKVAMVRLVG